jgi:hypothetical protein
VREKLASALLSPIGRKHASPKALLDLIVAAPERVPIGLTAQGMLAGALREAEADTSWSEPWRRAWSGWTAAQRSRALELVSGLRFDEHMVPFLRQRLHARPSEVPADARLSLLSKLGTLTAEDLRAAYDLSNPAEVDEATRWLVVSQEDRRRLELTPEVFEALRLAVRPDSPEPVIIAMATAFAAIPAVQPALAAALLGHQSAWAHGFVVPNVLLPRSSPEDETLWIKALQDPRHVGTRLSAASGMERVPTDGVKRALVQALDDPSPDVRAAALASLEAIQKLEDQKARWRERVK